MIVTVENIDRRTHLTKFLEIGNVEGKATD